MRVIVLEFLDTNIFHVSRENCSAFLVPRVECWDVDLDSLDLDIRLNRRLVADPHCTFRYVESEPDAGSGEEPGLAAFLEDPLLSGDATEEEVGLLPRQRFRGRRPNKLYYYRALQNLRDPLHFGGE